MDGHGLVQFLGAAAELARGAAAPTVQPVWGREILEARNPPRPSFPHREYDVVPLSHGDNDDAAAAAQRSFFFGPREIAAIRAQLSPRLRKRSTTFELIAASLWKCRTMALADDDDEETRITFAARTTRLRFPDGYYGNTIVLPMAISPAGELCARPLGYGYARSVADLMALCGRPPLALGRHGFILSDLTKLGFGDLDYGWGRPVYAPAAKAVDVLSFLGPLKNAKGVDGVVVPMCLPGPAMDRFVEEMAKLAGAPAR
ncbi:hypothetical protein EJB05_48277, partial [Eragrostis curvula]